MSSKYEPINIFSRLEALGFSRKLLKLGVNGERYVYFRSNEIPISFTWCLELGWHCSESVTDYWWQDDKMRCALLVMESLCGGMEK